MPTPIPTSVGYIRKSYLAVQDVGGRGKETANSVFAGLPVELVWKIFHIGALRSTKFAAKLARVSKDVHRWVLPILYSSLKLDTLQRHDRFIYACAYGMSSTAIRETRIKNLALEDSFNFRIPARFLPMFSQVVRLYIPIGWLGHANHYGLKPNELILSHITNMTDIAGLVILRTVTHLQLVAPPPSWSFQKYPHPFRILHSRVLRDLTSLSTLCVAHDDFYIQSGNTLEQGLMLMLRLPSLNLYILDVFHHRADTRHQSSVWKRAFQFSDERLVLRVSSRTWSLARWDEWVHDLGCSPWDVTPLERRWRVGQVAVDSDRDMESHDSSSVTS